MKVPFIAISAFCVALGAAQIAQASVSSPVARKASFQVKHYKIKSKTSDWDSKAGILKLHNDVVLTLSLADQTTAYLTCNEAIENRLEGKGDCWGKSQLTWQDLRVNSDHAAWDLMAKSANFDNNGTLVHNSFMNGQLNMSFDKSNVTSNSNDQMHMEAFKAKGVWNPGGVPEAAKQ